MTEESMSIEIPEALSEKLEVRYKIEVKTNFDTYDGQEFTVTRSHDEFEWLHQSLGKYRFLLYQA